VELDRLNFDNFVTILTQPNNALTKQYQALLQMEGVELDFTRDGLEEIARHACDMNERMENIGARRLHTIVERVLEEISFTATEHKGERIVIDKDYVHAQLAEVLANEDLSRFIL